MHPLPAPLGRTQDGVRHLTAFALRGELHKFLSKLALNRGMHGHTAIGTYRREASHGKARGGDIVFIACLEDQNLFRFLLLQNYDGGLLSLRDITTVKVSEAQIFPRFRGRNESSVKAMMKQAWLLGDMFPSSKLAKRHQVTASLIHYRYTG